MSGLTPVSFKKGRAHAPRLSKPYDPTKRHARYWTDAERDVLRDWFPKGGAPACEVRLPHRSRCAIYGEAWKLGLEAPKGGGPRLRAVLPNDIDERIRAGWAEDSARGFTLRLARKLGIPKETLLRRAAKLGLTDTLRKKEPAWTDAETALMRKVPLHNPDRCAEIFREHGFNRTPVAIIVRAKRLNLQRRDRSTFTARSAARLLGVDDKYLSCLCIAGDIKAVRRGTKRLPQQGGDSWAIAPAELRRFILDNLERIDIRKVEKFAFVRLLVGEELKP